jgi:hypothetical protein|eukprot:COSAG02_NODE_2991_length_7607_cov_1.980021_6_plen_53_part_00
MIGLSGQASYMLLVWVSLPFDQVDAGAPLNEWPTSCTAVYEFYVFLSGTAKR